MLDWRFALAGANHSPAPAGANLLPSSGRCKPWLARLWSSTARRCKSSLPPIPTSASVRRSALRNPARDPACFPSTLPATGRCRPRCRRQRAAAARPCPTRDSRLRPCRRRGAAEFQRMSLRPLARGPTGGTRQHRRLRPLPFRTGRSGARRLHRTGAHPGRSRAALSGFQRTAEPCRRAMDRPAGGTGSRRPDLRDAGRGRHRPRRARAESAAARQRRT